MSIMMSGVSLDDSWAFVKMINAWHRSINACRVNLRNWIRYCWKRIQNIQIKHWKIAPNFVVIIILTLLMTWNRYVLRCLQVHWNSDPSTRTTKIMLMMYHNYGWHLVYSLSTHSKRFKMIICRCELPSKLLGAKGKIVQFVWVSYILF